MLFRSVEGTDAEGVAGIRRLTKMGQKSEVRSLYLFFYECLRQIFGDALNPFEVCFSPKSLKQRIFSLFFHGKLLNLEQVLDEDNFVDLTDYCEVTVKIDNSNLRRHKKLNSLETNHSEKYPDGDISLSNCFEALMSSEKLDEENKWLCDKCNQYTRAHFEMTIKELPQILVIHLKRFKKSSQGSYTKINEAVHFPLNGLNLASFTTEPRLPENQCNYSLFGVVNHSGTVSAGHYTATVCNKSNSQNWVECDDEYVSSSYTGPQLHKHRAYILFYRKNHDPQPVSKLAESQVPL